MCIPVFGIYLNQFFKQRVTENCQVLHTVWLTAYNEICWNNSNSICRLFQKQFVFPQDSLPQKGLGPLYTSTFLLSMFPNGCSDSGVHAGGNPRVTLDLKGSVRQGQSYSEPWEGGSLICSFSVHPHLLW